VEVLDLSFNKRLKSLRINLGLNQKDLSEKLGIPRTTYSGYEQGNREPDFETLKKIANYFKCSIDYILCNSFEKDSLSVNSNNIHNEELSKRIKMRREALNMTQDQLVDFLNVKKDLVIEFENGNVLPNANILKNLSAILRTSADYLIGVTNDPKVYQKLFIDRLKDIMINLNITKEVLAKEIMVSDETMEKYLDGSLSPDIETLKRIAKSLNTTADYLIGLNDKSSQNELQIIDDWIKVKDGTDIKKIPIDELREFVEQYLKENKD
jgi:transcriptional regulator with XRE-family HTH domain